MNGKNLFFVSFITISLLMLTGCWDYRDIEEISNNIGLALDLADPDLEDIKIKGEPPVITATIQNVEPKQASSGEGQTDYQNISVTGNTLSKMVAENALFNRGPLIGQHLKITLIGEDVAKRMNLRNLLGYLLRSPHIRLSSTILCTKGKAKVLLESKEKGVSSELPALEIVNIANNHRYSLRTLKPVTYGRVGRFLASNKSFLLPCIVKKKDVSKLEDAAVISGKSKKMIGFMNSEEIAGVNWITGKEGSGLLNIYSAKDQEHPFAFAVRIDRMSSKITPHVQGDKISFDVYVKTDSFLTEDWIEPDDYSAPNQLEKLEKLTKQKIIYQMRAALHTMQKVYQADVAGFGDALRIHNFKVWKRIEKDWETKYFSDAPVRFHVDVSLKNHGMKIKDQ